MARPSRRTWLALLACVLAAACGSRVPPDVLAAADPPGLRPGVTVPASSPGSGTPGTTQPGGEGGEGSAPADTTSVATGSAGDQAQGIRRTPSANPAPTQPPGGNGGATDVGVTADTVTVASIATVGGPLPGATEGAQRGAAAYLAYVNSQGGVHGRRIKLLLGDDQLEPSRARAQFLELEPKVLAFVGSYATADSGYMDLVGRTGVPYFSLSIDPAGRKLRNVVSAQPAQEGYISTAPWAYTRQAYPDVKKLGFLSTGVAAVRINVDGTVAALRRVGYDVVYQAEANPTAPNYTAEIQQMRNRGVEALMLFAFELNMHVRFIRSMRQQGWNPPLKLSIIAYDSRFFDLLGAAGDGWHEPIYSLPYLDAAEAAANPVLGRFVEWNKRLFPNDKVDLFTVSGWINAELFVEALRKAGPRVTRSALLAAGNAIHDFDASGLYVPSDPGARTTSKCFLMVTGRGGRWVREHPSSGFECGLGEILKFK